ncbi:MAG: cytochrome-c oxidase, cbb3-type subunit III [Paracoccus sp. (in: a-proteobacteria)]|nr:cytochrome-c oxidase, cbb3-type subunit III [Paracoccus sp. (in: a-proteobacteria)]
MADNENKNGPDDHDSPQNPDNRIEVERQAADREHQADILAQPAGEEQGKDLHDPIPKSQTQRVTRRRIGKNVVEVKSTGHSWDGIEEYDNPLPRWWLWVFYATIIWSIGYMIAYPAIPLINGATQGVLGTNYRKEVAAEITRYNEANAPVQARLVEVGLNDIGTDPELDGYARNAGRAIFGTWCAQCHGAGGGGAVGFPSLVDDDWLFGGTMEDLHLTIQHGISDPVDPATRFSEMTAFGGPNGVLSNTEIDDVVHYVLQISGQNHDAARAAAGEPLFADNCTACHGPDGTGDRMQGAPNLTDAIWIWGGDAASLRETIHNGRNGVMPSWNERLTEAEIRAVTHYVHGLGGGE